ncbi:FAD NAD(P)-binding domain-containing [Lecanosticta acicola]|uniref:FAD NAD(P)-binding domain-containing n=1 Tax=Lecanosticta acicola TaxID=111012 RepID=A0AAI8Z1I1_9PEZI|nr:FAD NAD(P)-binding domain-containing [Lecanosticta acicola]
MTGSVVRDPLCGISVLISGSGICGLMTALECWRKGCTVRILERAKTEQTQGDSFMIGPSALNAFRNWPELEEREREVAYKPMISFYNHRGERLAGPFNTSNVVSKNWQHLGDEDSPITRQSRPKFHSILLEQLRKIGIEVEYDNGVVDYFEDAPNQVGGVVLEDGSKHTANVVVAADGVRSKSWSLVAGHPVPAKSSGNGIFRVAYPVELALADPMIAERFRLYEDGRSSTELWVGPGLQAFFWRSEDEMSWAITHPDWGSAEESWGNKVHPDEVLKFTATIDGWPEVADRVIRATPTDSLVDWKLMWRDPQPTWTSPGGHVVQLGDAAHTFLPSSANGGTQAMEDAISLAACIALGGKTNIPDATRVHNLLRFERVSCLQAWGIANADDRDTNRHKQEENKFTLTIGKWILDHDPEQYAKEKYAEALAHLKEGKSFQNTNTPPGMVYRPWTIDGLIAARERGEPTVLGGDWS